ncbi:MAG: hypothetical protein K6F86_04410 [Lachnospiraceae bacterium]|nr:hypothetical protein [Lachnospiraceae bacterium]
MKTIKKNVCVSDSEYLSEAMDFVRDSLRRTKIPSKLIISTQVNWKTKFQLPYTSDWNLLLQG